MKISSLATVLALAVNGNRFALAFRVDPGGNNDLMKFDVENALLVQIKPVLDTGNEFPPLRNEILGTEAPCKYEYWDRPDIHTFGNTGVGGAIHAAMAPIATKIIDVKAYGGVDVRKNVSGSEKNVLPSLNSSYLYCSYSPLVDFQRAARIGEQKSITIRAK